MAQEDEFGAGLDNAFEVLGMDEEAPSERRGSSGRRRGRDDEEAEELTLRFVDREGVLLLDDGTLPPLPDERRRGRRGTSEDAVWERDLSALPRNQIGEWIRKLDHKLTPRTGLRAYDPKEEGWHERTSAGPDPADAPDLSGVKRVLLLVHGTFSHSGALLKQIVEEDSGAGENFLDWVATTYDRVLTFDHPTLASSPVINAHALARALGDYGGDIDVVCHSRGGLVTRWWLEGFDRGPGRRRVVFVASPLAGTGLAAPPNLRSSLSMLSNVARALGTAAAAAPFLVFVSGVFKVVGSVSNLAAKTPALDAAVALVPGLAAQQRVGNTPEIHSLRAAPPDPAGLYFAVRANFEPVAPGWKFWKYFRADQAKNIGADTIFTGHNDLVVDSGSMVELSDTVVIPGGQVLDFGTTDVVHHTNYFSNERTLRFIEDVLSDGPGLHG